MTYDEFTRSQPPLPTLVIVEGTERLLAQRAITTIVDRVLQDGDRSLNCEQIDILEPDAFGKIEAGAAAMAFLAPARVVVVKNIADRKSDERRAFWKMARTIRPGNVVIIEDLVPPTSKRPEPLSKAAGTTALVIDTTLTPAIRTQFVRDLIAELNIDISDDAIEAIGQTGGDLHAVAGDLRKFALYNRTITIADVIAESVTSGEPKTFAFAGMLIEGRKNAAVTLADELLANDRGAAIPMLYSLATDYLTIWEMTRAGGTVPPKQRWREKTLRPYAQAIGERRAKLGLERAIRGFKAIVTGEFDDPRTVIMLCIDAHPLVRT